MSHNRVDTPGSLVLVTGAGSGIGRATALAFADAGARVLAVDIDRETAEKTAAACTLYHFTHVLDTRSHRTQCKEWRIHTLGNDIGKRSLTHSRRSPKNERRDSLAIYHASYHSPLAHKMSLAYVVVQCLRTQSFC
jgi:NAD(P)-dependent dehydrogenase (short-subunit alcohol dehydrogenase family)